MRVADSPPSYACALPFGFWFGSELQAGIDQFSQEADRDFHLFSNNQISTILEQSWIEGLVAFISDKSRWKKLSVLPCPVINVSGRMREPPCPSVLNDAHLMGKKGAQHLIQCGATEIHYVSFTTSWQGFPEQRLAGVQDVCKEYNVPCHTVTIAESHEKDVHYARQLQFNRIETWLKSRTPPVTIITSNGIEGNLVNEVAAHIGWKTGKDLALLQLTDSREDIQKTKYETSCIPQDWRQVGYQAAKHLYEWVEMGEKPPHITWIPPLPAVLTPSSDPSFNSDLWTRFSSLMLHSPDVGLRVQDVAHALNTSESTLLREVKKATGKSPKEHLILRQLEEAKRLLRSTDLSSTEISSRCGYREVHGLNSAFRRYMEMSPGQWRKEHRT